MNDVAPALEDLSEINIPGSGYNVKESSSEKQK